GSAVARELKSDGRPARFMHVDVGSAEAVRAAAASLAQAFGRVDVLVNNAAMMNFDRVVEMGEGDWDRLMAVNLRSVFIWCKYCIPHMDGGAIVNVSSVHAFRTTPNTAAYA